ncbi:hypothetical protein TNCV_578361 [Trichonephila clavipes]|nr:hypothetical protein TNCV_578361 [Trichonephila clavipes]
MSHCKTTRNAIDNGSPYSESRTSDGGLLLSCHLALCTSTSYQREEFEHQPPPDGESSVALGLELITSLAHKPRCGHQLIQAPRYLLPLKTNQTEGQMYIKYFPSRHVGVGCGSPVIKVSTHDRHVRYSSPVPLKTRHVGQRYTLNLSRAEMSFCWCGSLERWVSAQVSSTSLEDGSKLCGSSPKALVTATAGSDVVQSGRPIFDDFFQHLWPSIGNNTTNVVFQMVKRLWLIRIDQ